MTLSAKILGLCTAASLAAGLTLPAFAQSTNPPPTTTTTTPPTSTANPSPNAGNPAMNCPSNGTAMTGTPGSASTTGTTGTTGTTPNTSAPPVSPNTPANTNAAPINSNNPGAHAKTRCSPAAGQMTPSTMAPPATMPASTGTNMGNGPGGSNMNALSNNPNGSGWLQKFNRPMVAATAHHHSKHRPKHANGGGGQ